MNKTLTENIKKEIISDMQIDSSELSMVQSDIFLLFAEYCKSEQSDDWQERCSMTNSVCSMMRLLDLLK